MPQIGIRYGSRYLSWESAREESEAGLLPYPVPLIRAMEDNRTLVAPTASSLAGCLRQFELKRTVDYYASPSSSLPAIFGTAFHALMEEMEGDGGYTEHQMSTAVVLPLPPPYNIVRFSGKVDRLVPGQYILDYKTKVHISKGFETPQAHIQQINIYNWLAYANGYTPAKEWRILYTSQTWTELRHGPTADVRGVEAWVTERLLSWAVPRSRDELPDSLPERDNPNPQAQGPCRYCPVRDECELFDKPGYDDPIAVLMRNR